MLGVIELRNIYDLGIKFKHHEVQLLKRILPMYMYKGVVDIPHITLEDKNFKSG